MMRTGLRILGVHSEDAVMIGDRMDTDMIAGIETGLDTVLVLSGVTSRSDIRKYPYRPRLVLNGVGISRRHFRRKNKPFPLCLHVRRMHCLHYMLDILPVLLII